MSRPTHDQIQEVIAWANDHDGTYAGMTYEQGVADALLWVLGDGPNPQDP